MKIISKNRLRLPSIECIGGASVRKITLLLTVVSAFSVAFSASAARSDSLNFNSQFVFKDRNGKTVTAPIVEDYQKKKIVFPTAKVVTRETPQQFLPAIMSYEQVVAHSD